MKTRFFWILLISCYPIIGFAQTATSRALAYDTLLAAAARRGELTKRLNYRETVSIENREQTNVVFVYKKLNEFYIRIFILNNDKTDSLIAYPEQKLIDRKLRTTCATYFDKVVCYGKSPRYEYIRTMAKPLAQAPLFPQWTIRIVIIEPPKRPFTTMFHCMNTRDYPAEDAQTIRRMNRDFAVFQKAIHEWIKQNNILIKP